jgi:hypothetical protein
MNRRIALVVCLLCFAVLLAATGAAADSFPFAVGKGMVVGKPAVYKHLAIYPVLKEKMIHAQNYMTLDEAHRKRAISIEELSSESVPTVIIHNTGDRPVFILAGEIIIGGKQDRMLSYDALIPAGKKIEVAVKCVEHGRWHGASREFESGGAVGSLKVRNALQFKDQADVWAEVGKACAEYGAETETGTYRAVLSSKDIDKRSEPFIGAMKKGLEDENAVGMIMAINGRIVCADVFADSKYFAKIKDKLIKAYVLDAIGAEEESRKLPGKEEIKALFSELDKADSQELKRYEENVNRELESDEIMGSESRDADGKLQHLNLYGK